MRGGVVSANVDSGKPVDLARPPQSPMFSPRTPDALPRTDVAEWRTPDGIGSS
jgi:hypothetical protein